ncbi:hypothetical protein D3C83_65670 [compost metagenome]
MLALDEMRNAHGEFDHLDAALDRTDRIAQRLAVFVGDEARQLFAVRIQQLAVAHQYACAAKGRRVAPLRIGRLRGGHRGIDVRAIAERYTT